MIFLQKTVHLVPGSPGGTEYLGTEQAVRAQEVEILKDTHGEVSHARIPSAPLPRHLPDSLSLPLSTE